MKKLTLILFTVTSWVNILAQTDSFKTISLEVSIMVHDMTDAQTELSTFMERRHIVPDLLNESNRQFSAKFVLTEKAYFEFVEKISTWGAVYNRKMTSVNYTEKLESIEREISRLRKEEVEYSELLKQVNVNSQTYMGYWNKQLELRTSIRELNKTRDRYLNNNKKFSVDLTVTEENHLSSEPNFSFVNMPGIQYSFFIPANSESGRFPGYMHGYAIKYLMNRRKTYLELALFRSGLQNQTTQFDELYKFGLGQDFYSTHLGRGTRKFFNLYSGFNIGVFILTGNEDNLTSWYATPSVGLEIYKSKKILLDTKAGYFLPFKENRNMRGFLLEAAFNVVF